MLVSHCLNSLKLSKVLAKDCKFVQPTAAQYREDLVRDAFINGMESRSIRQRLLEQPELDLKTAINLTNTLDMAQKQSASNPSQRLPTVAVANSGGSVREPKVESQTCAIAGMQKKKRSCYICGAPGNTAQLIVMLETALANHAESKGIIHENAVRRKVIVAPNMLRLH